MTHTDHRPRICFLGLGVMGNAMLRNLVAHGYDVAGYDVSPAAYERLAGVDFRRAGSPAEAAHGCEVVITMLPTSAHVREALLGPDGAAQALAPGHMVFDMSTGDPAAVDELAQELASRGLRFLDAPVGRTPQEAAQGKALIMVGGSPEDAEQAQPIFEAMANEIIYIGPVGSAIRLKLVNNYMSMVTMVLTGEALMFAAKLGLERSTVVKVLSNTVAGRGQLLTNYPRKVLAGDITPDFPIRMGFKDINLAMNLAASIGAPLGLGGYAREMFALAKSWGRQEQDCTALLLLLEDLARVPHHTPPAAANG
ncbi:MAG: NAD(P)-dependent oxidoreductase [Comamonas sp.]